MLLSRFAKVMAVSEGLIGKAISIAPRTRTFPDSVGDPGSGYLRLDHGLHRRENSRLTAGTLTITVAPDPTCGFDVNEESVTCPSSKRCSWESGRIDKVFCDLRYIRTACLDRTDALDPDLCDLDCIEDTNTLLCVESSFPYCLPVEFSGSISQWICHSTSSFLVLFSTLDMQPRDFTTVVLVDGNPVTSWTNAVTMDPPTTSTTTRTVTVTKESTGTTQTKPPPPGVNVGAVVGGVIGGVAFVSLVVIGITLFLRRKREKPEPNDSLPDHAIQSNMPDAKAMAVSPTITQPYSPTLISSIEPQNGGIPPPAFYQHPEPHGTAGPGHQSMEAHELSGRVGDHQSGPSPGAK
ncbi:Hypothetical protein NCS54_01224300 [Fusarium falciforme]|uniref:Hypothetical protein n=1 Tax=Fusarium falciforme TaxID=195108 RepID=UPI002300C214|nr:Hypothetical protein NCS54_01224300 [Fusarium falciforme]WAO94651.1 Hypothetical protein NCS54_01224300 [Fusarium falciforme]